MPRVHFVKKAQKDNDCVKKGESYFWWKFRYGGKRMSTTLPRGSQLTQSAFLGAIYAVQEAVEDYTLPKVGTTDELDAALGSLGGDVENWASDVRQCGEDAQESFDNIPEGLQEGPTGQMLEGRVDSAEEFATELESVDLEPNVEDGWKADDFQERLENALEELQQLSYEGE